MAITKAELDRFYEFASRRIEGSDEALDLDDLTVEWESRNHRDEFNAAIREGLDDIAAGRVQPWEEVDAEIRREFGFDPRT